MKVAIPVLITAIALGACGFVSGPSGTVKDFYKNLCAGNADGAKRDLSSTVKLDASVINLSFQGRSVACKNAGGVKDFDLNEQSIDDTTAGVMGDVLFNDGSKESVRMKLLKESGQWKLTWNIK